MVHRILSSKILKIFDRDYNFGVFWKNLISFAPLIYNQQIYVLNQEKTKYERYTVLYKKLTINFV